MEDERTERRDCLIALGYVAAAAALRWAIGPPDRAGTFLLFSAVVALAAWTGGVPPALVALFGSILAIDVGFSTTTATMIGPWTAFAANAMLVIWLIARTAERLRQSEADLDATRRRVVALEIAERDARLLNTAYDRLAAFSDDAAAVVLNSRGLITAWTTGATHVYGATSSEMLGVAAQALFGVSTDASGIRQLLADAAATGRARWSGAHRRHDGTAFDVDLEVRPIDRSDMYTFVVRDLTRERHWEAFRAATTRSEAALREDAELMRRQLAALESVTDPMLDSTRRADVEDLLERLRVAVDADGVAFVQPGGVRRRMITAQGVQPTTATPRGQADARRPPNRVLLIQNDSARVAQSSVSAWPETVSCLLAVPIAAAGQVRGVIEVVNERPRRATDADMALIRVVANRIASFGGDGYGEAGAVA